MKTPGITAVPYGELAFAVFKERDQTRVIQRPSIVEIRQELQSHGLRPDDIISMIETREQSTYGFMFDVEMIRETQLEEEK